MATKPKNGENTVKTVEKLQEPEIISPLKQYQFKPGVCANPNGRPKGSRNALSEKVIKDLLKDWEAHGPSAIEDCRLSNPGVYLKVVTSLIPKELSIKNGTNDFDAILDQFDDNQLNQLYGLLASLSAATTGGQDEIKALT